MRSNEPRAFLAQRGAQFYQYNQFTANGLPVTNYTELDVFAEFRNRMTFSANLWADNIGPRTATDAPGEARPFGRRRIANLLINLGRSQAYARPDDCRVLHSADYGNIHAVARSPVRDTSARSI